MILDKFFLKYEVGQIDIEISHPISPSHLSTHGDIILV